MHDVSAHLVTVCCFWGRKGKKPPRAPQGCCSLGLASPHTDPTGWQCSCMARGVRFSYRAICIFISFIFCFGTIRENPSPPFPYQSNPKAFAIPKPSPPLFYPSLSLKQRAPLKEAQLDKGAGN